MKVCRNGEARFWISETLNKQLLNLYLTQVAEFGSHLSEQSFDRTEVTFLNDIMHILLHLVKPKLLLK